MANHDFYCSRCGQVLIDVNVPADIGARRGAPVHCDQQTVWIPAAPMMDVGGVKGAAFTAFDTYDGQNRPVRVENYRQMHKLERDSEQQARNGEGQAIRFRLLHQDQSNKHVNTFGEPGQQKPTSDAVRRFAPRQITEEPTYGPGVSDANTSALKD
jgi:hypothetical protein